MIAKRAIRVDLRARFFVTHRFPDLPSFLLRPVSSFSQLPHCHYFELPSLLPRDSTTQMFVDFKLIDTRIMGGFGFLEFENERVSASNYHAASPVVDMVSALIRGAHLRHIFLLSLSLLRRTSMMPSLPSTERLCWDPSESSIRRRA